MTLRETWPLGATTAGTAVHFGVWAPNPRTVDVLLESGATHRLERDADGIHRGLVAGIGAGTRYKYRLDGGDAFPDPRSRFQPDGVHDWSEVVDPSAYVWSDAAWTGLTGPGVIYELHVGTYTPEGTFRALTRELPELKRLGITTIELMPVAEFPGQRNWGYDGVDLWAPSRAYGRPDDLRALIDAAHQIGLGVLLDVVYNHLGPDGNYLRLYANDYFTSRHVTPWGDAINYDGPNSRFVRDFVIENAIHWVEEYHLDGFRLDATDQIADDSAVPILHEMRDRIRAAAARPVLLIAEDNRNDVRLIRSPDQGGWGLDAVWADDFHHEIRVLLTGARENYYANYTGSTAAIATTIEAGFEFQGQIRPSTGKPRGTRVTDEPASSFVFCIQNHDQVGNRPYGERLHHDIETGRYAVASTLLLLAPETPLLFQGQEFAASTPFLFFTDHNPELGRLVTEGRRREFAGFREFQDEALRESIPDPQAESTFLNSKLRLEERQTHAGIYALYTELIRLRRDDPVLAVADRARCRASAAGAEAVVMRRWNAAGDTRVLFANWGAAAEVPVASIAALAGMPAGGWHLLLSTAETRFDGDGDVPSVRFVNGERIMIVPARSAALWQIVPE